MRKTRALKDLLLIHELTFVLLLVLAWLLLDSSDRDPELGMALADYQRLLLEARGGTVIVVVVSVRRHSHHGEHEAVRAV